LEQFNAKVFNWLTVGSIYKAELVLLLQI